MAEKLYKRQYTEKDLIAVQKYVRANAVELFIECWVNNSDDGIVYPISVVSIKQAIQLAARYYDNIIASEKVIELLMRDSCGEYVMLYHKEKNREGLSYEVLRYAEGK